MTTAPIFIPNDPQTILSEWVELYQSITGRVLQPAQVERLLIGAQAYRETLVREAIQNAAVQNLVAFAVAPHLDLLGELVGVYRLPSAPAVTTLEFTLIVGHSGVVIPANTRVSSKDGKVAFATDSDLVVAPGVVTAQVDAFADPVGVIGNNYAADEITEILDPRPWVIAATNIALTAGGADEESNENLRERIRLAPSAFSTAGSRGAYVYHTKTASTLIVDVAVTQPTPGTVQVFPLLAGGVTTPAPILALVLAALNDETVRPLTDTVLVTSPTIVNYLIELEVVAYEGEDLGVLQSDIEAAVNAYKDTKALRMGQDVTKDQLLAVALLKDRVYSVDVVAPVADVIIAATQAAFCTGVSVTITGTTNG